MRIVFKSVSELEEALKRTAAAHHTYETHGGQRDWPAWYAEYLANSQPADLGPEGQVIADYRRAEQAGDIASFEKGYF